MFLCAQKIVTFKINRMRTEFFFFFLSYSSVALSILISPRLVFVRDRVYECVFLVSFSLILRDLPLSMKWLIREGSLGLQCVMSLTCCSLRFSRSQTLDYCAEC